MMAKDEVTERYAEIIRRKDEQIKNQLDAISRLLSERYTWINDHSAPVRFAFMEAGPTYEVSRAELEETSDGENVTVIIWLKEFE